MHCCFCRCACNSLQRANAAALCPDCLAQLLSVSPQDKRYPWFVAALRRSLYEYAPNSNPAKDYLAIFDRIANESK